MLDMSAAFDVVDHQILLQKLSLYGLHNDALNWISSYLSERTQCVTIDGSLSKMLPVKSGVPQGSILGPLLYTVFTNELPEVIHDEHLIDHHTGNPIFHNDKDNLGCICCYTDDTTLTCTDSTSGGLTRKLSTCYDKIANFLRDNRLKLNDEKTNLLVIDRGGSKSKYEQERKVVINTPSLVISPTETQLKLLGCNIHENLKWTDHLMTNENSLLKGLNQRLAALQKLARIASFRDRKMVANGIFMSKLLYLISLWGGCSKELKNALQVIQNKAARVVARREASLIDMYKQIGWLSVNQLIFYHTVLLVFKVRGNGSPMYLSSMFHSSYAYNTRQASRELLRVDQRPRLELTKSSFKW